MPVYNGEKYLKQCIESLTNQTLEDIEIICINDCSTDKSLDILNAFAQKDSRIKIINQSINQGQSEARNLGIQLAKGEYIMFIDQDDWYELETCKKAYKQISENQNDFLIFNIRYHYVESGNNKIDNKRLVPFEKVLSHPKIKPYEVGTNIFFSAFIWCQIYKKSFILQNDIKFYKEKQSDDVPFFIKAMVSANTISIIHEPFYNYRIYPEQTTSVRNDLWEATFRTRALSYDFVLNSKHAKEFINPFLVYYINSVMHWFKHFSKNNSDIEKQYLEKMQKLFVELDKKHNISEIANDINYEYFKEIINSSRITA